MTRAASDLNIPGARLIGATTADCAALAELAHLAHRHPWSERQYLDSVNAGHDCWLLRTEGGQPIASCVISQLFDTAEILDIAVAPEWRRRGIAEALLSRLLAQLPLQINRVLLDVRVGNTPARGLYRKLGFIEDGLRRNYYPADEGAREDAVLMSLSLNDSYS
ncbi:ribosomal protein S18-alanine N-acetyltransferase [Microbulbifer magnicolonia]|uniref:ribosomal protein S18-alanine N-acetyltransferase n=1 Tax=Microbulbifer magnicolonia TaxID=3109744 RepID=UPI002B411DC6|nr:ribosomal protein S18-alanine N-acetyltransferase [Microbulbifer sp. GG15]